MDWSSEQRQRRSLSSEESEAPVGRYDEGSTDDEPIERTISDSNRIERIATNASSVTGKLYRERSHHPLDDFGAHTQDAFEKIGENEVDYPDGDFIRIKESSEEHPYSWSTGKKLAHTSAYGWTTFTAQFTASVLSPCVGQMASEFHVGQEVGMLAFSAILFGNALGPLFFAPLSEVYGRKLGVFVPCLISGILMLVIANVTSIWAVIVFRILAGVFAAAPIVSSGGALADLWPAKLRAAAMAFYSTNITIGSSSSPVFGALLVTTGGYGWRWACWLGGLLQVAVSVVNLLFLSESYVPVLEKHRAKGLRIETGFWALHCDSDEWKLSAKEFFYVHFARPVYLFLTPIIFLMANYSSFVFGLFFLVISSVGDLFQKYHDFAFVTSYLPLFAVTLGFAIGSVVNVLGSRRFARLTDELGHRADPEERLITMMAFAWLTPAGCFVYGWTLYLHVHWIASCVGLLLVGVGFAIIFQGCLVYMVDSYAKFGASAIATNTFMRSVYAGVFPLFSRQLYAALGPHWGNSLLGFIALVAVPIPWFFYKYGPWVRQHSPYEKILT